MRAKLETFVKEFAKSYSENPNIKSRWDEPVFAYASAKDPLFNELKTIIGEYHKLPGDIMENGETVITYFVPLVKSIADSNTPGYFSSEDWVFGYFETIDLINGINNGLEELFSNSGWKLAVTADHRSWDPETMKCDWSHRHAAYIAGLGTFGINRALITEKGVCGRIGTIITDAKIEPTMRPQEEYCLYKRNGSCGICLNNCPASALDVPDEYDNKKCMDVTFENADKYKEIGFADVCAKCMTGVPCSTRKPD